jgi:hypothetical protein
VIVLGVTWWVRMRSQQDARDNAVVGRYRKQKTKITRREHVEGFRTRDAKEELQTLSGQRDDTKR